MSDLISVEPLSPELSAWLEEQGIPAFLHRPTSRQPSLADVQAALPEVPTLRVSYATSSSGRTVIRMSGQPPEQEWAELIVGESGTGICFTHGSRNVVTAAVGHLARRCGPLVLVHASGARPSLISASPTTIDVLGGWAEDLIRGAFGAS